MNFVIDSFLLLGLQGEPCMAHFPALLASIGWRAALSWFMQSAVANPRL